MRIRCALLPMVLIAGCVVDPGVDFAGDPTPRPVPIGGGDGGVECAHPEEGCVCEPGRPEIDCYLDPIEAEDGSLLCNAGTRYCRDGLWTGCEAIREFVIAPPSPTALVTGPDACNPCNPRCFVSRDTPGPEDLPDHSTRVSYDPTRGGIELTPVAPAPEMLIDTDGDGVPDVADECVGPGAFLAADGSCYGDRFLFHMLPYGASASDALDISTQIRTADIYFLMDTTGSMGDELARLKADLTTGPFGGCTGGIMGAIRCRIPDAWFGVGYFDDYPVNPYGASGDFVFQNVIDLGGSLPAAQTAMNGLRIHNGSDLPESNVQALWAIATGGRIASGSTTYLSTRTGCAAGRWGYPCFRAGTIPIVIHITDSTYHNGPDDSDPYCVGGSITNLPLPSTTAVSGNERQDASAHGVIDITDSWVGFTGNTSAMANDINFGCGSGAPDAVFRVRLTSRQSVRFTTEGSGYDTAIGVYPVSGGAGACNDDVTSGTTWSRLDQTLDPGEYWVIVDGYSNSRGAYRLSMGRHRGCTGYEGVSWDDTVTAISAQGIKVITVQTCGNWSSTYCQDGENQARTLGISTGSLGASGAPYVLRGNANGTGLSTTIVDAVIDLANYSRMDVTARAVGDTRGFTNTPITAVSVGAGSCAGISGGTTFLQCLPGTRVNFRVTFNNHAVMPAATTQVFSFFIELVGNGTVVLARVPVRIVVPANVETYPASGSYWREYDSTLRCAINERPDWGSLSWNADIPAGTRIEFELRALATSRATRELTTAALATAMPIGRIIAPPSTSPIDVAAALRTAGYADGMKHLRVTAVLYSNTARTASPALTSMEVTYSCLPAE